MPKEYDPAFDYEAAFNQELGERLRVTRRALLEFLSAKPLQRASPSRPIGNGKPAGALKALFHLYVSVMNSKCRLIGCSKAKGASLPEIILNG